MKLLEILTPPDSFIQYFNIFCKFASKDFKKFKRNNYSIMRKVLFVLFFCGIVGSISAQEESDNSLLVFLHAGYGYLPGKTSGLTNSSDSYVKTLSSGMSWNAQVYYQHKMLIVGLLYSGYNSSGSLKSGSDGIPRVIDPSQAQLRPVQYLNSSDNILTTYIAPQLGANIPAGEYFSIAFNGGIGSMSYRNNSTVYEKDRKVTGNSLGLNLGLKGIYNFSTHFGVSLEALGINASLGSVNIKYHDENFTVKYPDRLSLNQLTFSLGLKYSL
jgi:hypothetical protein